MNYVSNLTLVKDESIADDLCQDVFVKIINKGYLNESVYLMIKIAKDTCFDFFKKKNRTILIPNYLEHIFIPENDDELSERLEKELFQDKICDLVKEKQDKTILSMIGYEEKEINKVDETLSLLEKIKILKKSAQRRNTYLNHREKNLSRQKEYNNNNKNSISEYQKKYNKNYVEKNKDFIKQYQSQYRKAS